MTDHVRIAEVREWFKDKGFGLLVSVDEDHVAWAHLTSKESGQVVVRQYGRGDSEVAAAERAMQRYQSEQ